MEESVGYYKEFHSYEADKVHPFRRSIISITLEIAAFVIFASLDFPWYVLLVIGFAIFIDGIALLLMTNFIRESRLLRVRADGKQPINFVPTTFHQGKQDVPLGEITGIVFHRTENMTFLYFDTEKTENRKASRFYLPLTNSQGDSWRLASDYDFLKQTIKNTNAPDDKWEEVGKSTAISKMFEVGKNEAIEKLFSSIFDPKV